MAMRTLYIPSKNDKQMVKTIKVDFKWIPGMSKTQIQKCIASLHEYSSKKFNLTNILEISTKSTIDLGKKLSAFNLKVKLKNNSIIPVECAFQGSKIFELGGPYTDLYSAESREAKKDIRLKNSGNLIGFSLLGEKWPLTPKTIFYDWIYISALKQNMNLSNELLKYDGFTDISFNPMKSINCQAYSAALFVYLKSKGILEDALKTSESFKELFKDNISDEYLQGHLF